MSPSEDLAVAGGLPLLLIVDDDEDFVDLLTFRLRRKYRLRVARNGEEALAKVAETPPDLVLLDVMMPRLGGWSVCWTLKNHERFRTIPILFVTATSAGPSQIARADGYLQKPFEMETLDRKIEELLSI